MNRNLGYLLFRLKDKKNNIKQTDKISYCLVLIFVKQSKPYK